MPRTRIKICGITRNEDALQAARLGADAIGMVFYKCSPRAVRAEQVRDILHDLPPYVTVVALFVDPGEHEVEAVLAQPGISCLQFQGRENVDFCRSFSVPVIKAIRVENAAQAKMQCAEYSPFCNILLDSFDQKLAGGTGKCFDWTIAREIRRNVCNNLVLAGGLNVDNVEVAIRTVNPAAIDISSGVESAPGIKDHIKLAEFIARVRKIDDTAAINQQNN